MKFKINCELDYEELCDLVKMLPSINPNVEEQLVIFDIENTDYKYQVIDNVLVITKDVKDQIKVKMKDLNISYEKMASYFNISKQYLSQMLNGKKPMQEKIERQMLEILGLA